MMKAKTLVLNTVILVTLSLSATAQEKKDTPAAKPATEVKLRQELMNKLQGQLNALYASIYQGTEVSNPNSEIAGHLAMMTALADEIPGSFPTGSTLEGSQAGPEILKDRAQFEQNANQLKTKLESFREALSKKDRAELAKAYEEIDISATCNACHTVFHKKITEGRAKATNVNK